MSCFGWQPTVMSWKAWPVTSPQESPALEWRSVTQQTLGISILEHNLKTNKQTTTTKQVYTHMKEWIYMVLWAETWDTHSRVRRVPLGPLIVGGWGWIERFFFGMNENKDACSCNRDVYLDNWMHAKKNCVTAVVTFSSLTFLTLRERPD